MVNIASYDNPEQAYIVAGMLNSNGIPAMVQNNNNLYVPIFNGVNVMVPDKDAEKALILVRQHDEGGQ
ncbi:MAG: DUF2007 domain-containing protein [Bacteroides sp.]|nr:DUF2007 domain-containing protein [Bacteroides sp.]